MNRSRFDLSGHVALVTGASRGIGQAIATGLAEAGADVALLGRERTALEKMGGQIAVLGQRTCSLVADVRIAAQVDAAVRQAIGALGRLDIVVNSAGAQLTGPSVEVAEADWDAVVDVNLKGTFLVCQSAARHALLHQRAGRIINLASTFSFTGFPEFAAYCASKGGVLMLTRALAVEWAPFGINVNAIAPCATRTELNAYLLDDPGFMAGFLPRFPA